PENETRKKETAARARVAPPSIGRARSSDVQGALCTGRSFGRKPQSGATSVGRPRYPRVPECPVGAFRCLPKGWLLETGRGMRGEPIGGGARPLWGRGPTPLPSSERDRAVVVHGPARVVSDLPGVAVGIHEAPRVAAPERLPRL